MTTIEIDSVDLVLDYNYRATEITDHHCRICNEHLMQPILNKKDNSIDTRISLGKCGHSFHTNCIEKHKQQINPIAASNNKAAINSTFDNRLPPILCPIDQTEWIQKRILDNKNTFGKLILSDINYVENPAIHYRTPKK